MAKQESLRWFLNTWSFGSTEQRQGGVNSMGQVNDTGSLNWRNCKLDAGTLRRRVWKGPRQTLAKQLGTSEDLAPGRGRSQEAGQGFRLSKWDARPHTTKVLRKAC